MKQRKEKSKGEYIPLQMVFSNSDKKLRETRKLSLKQERAFRRYKEQAEAQLRIEKLKPAHENEAAEVLELSLGRSEGKFFQATH